MKFNTQPTGVHGKAAWPLAQRLDAQIFPDPNSGCWIWGGAACLRGYGRITIVNKNYGAHRVVYELHKGSIPAGMVLDHKCRTPACVNPDHLEPVEQRENILRGNNPNALKTHCPVGHPYDSINTYITPDGHRQCRVCRRIHDLNSKERKRHAF